jgi:hypothetical protein
MEKEADEEVKRQQETEKKRNAEMTKKREEQDKAEAESGKRLRGGKLESNTPEKAEPAP